MKLGHKKIKEMLPEYLKDSLPREMRNDIDAHLKECQGCKEEFAFITDISDIDVPDPGDLFYKTLPQRVRGVLSDEKQKKFSLRSLFFRPLPVALTAAVLILLIFTFMKNNQMKEFDPYSKDPFTVAVLDYSGVTEKDVVLITEEFAINEQYIHSEVFMGYSYVREFAYLNTSEMDGLNEALKKEQKTGG